MGAGGAEDGPVVSLEDFDLLAVLGRGGFGKVMQVRHRTTDTVYAMKILKKSELRRRRQVERTQTERTILANVRHPFIVCLHYAFQSPQKLYMVMDFVQGGDFFTLMRKFKRIPEEWVRLYVMEVAMALQHLHDMDVVYRDLKPENILLCSDGHLKLTDFGLSRLADDNIVTRSFCGTEQYMSPEMLLQQGHNYRMDWWCLGLLMHEMVSARHPFHGPTHYDTLRNMVTKPPTVDPRLSPGASAVVKHLLVKNPRTRLCCKGGTLEMKNIPYFQVVDWDALLERRIEMPYKPRLVGETDVSSFETTFTRWVTDIHVGGNSSFFRLFPPFHSFPLISPAPPFSLPPPIPFSSSSLPLSPNSSSLPLSPRNPYLSPVPPPLQRKTH
ncbi:kinase-like domain-containing protein [Ochromonadaceae sp. CCMP2298]|nr:kinase-like domain-containing protein [Ochromonadaceae sp. CCMP2298]